MWCGPSPRPARACGWRSGDPSLPDISSRSAGSGQINAVQANVRFPDSLLAAAQGADAVINLVGILFPSGKQTFDAVQDEGARHVAEAARAAGAQALVHVSAIGASAELASVYARSKAEGEAAVREVFPGAVILRPSVVFGPEDDFFNRFAALARIAPVLPLIGGGQTKFQPVFVGDVAKAVIAGLTGKAKSGAPYELGGPEVLTLKEVMQRVLAYTMRKRLLVPVPFWLAKLKGAFLQLLPTPPLTVDQVRLLESDNVVSEAAKRRQAHARRAGHRAGGGRGRRARLSRAVPSARPVLDLPPETLSDQV